MIILNLILRHSKKEKPPKIEILFLLKYLLNKEFKNILKKFFILFDFIFVLSSFLNMKTPYL